MLQRRDVTQRCFNVCLPGGIAYPGIGVIQFKCKQGLGAIISAYALHLLPCQRCRHAPEAGGFEFQSAQQLHLIEPVIGSKLSRDTLYCFKGADRVKFGSLEGEQPVNRIK